MGIIYILVIFFSSPSLVLGQTAKKKGIFQEFDRLISQFPKAYSPLIQKTNNLKTLTLSPQYLAELFFFSDLGYAKWPISTGNPKQMQLCKFYSLLENSLLYDSHTQAKSPIITQIPVEYGDLLGKTGKGSIALNDFLSWTYKKNCLSHIDLKKSFSRENFAGTVQNLDFPLPKNSLECSKASLYWKDNLYIPYLCKYAQLPWNGGIKLQEDLKKQVGEFTDQYLQLLCESIKKENFFSWCSNYTSQDLWNQMASSQVDPAPLNVRGRLVLNKLDAEKIGASDLRKVASQMTENKKICEEMGQEQYPSGLRGYDCEKLSEVLKIARLESNFIDSPMKIPESFVLALGRLRHHFEQGFSHTKETTPSAMMSAYYAQFVLEKKMESYWRYYACYLHLADKTKVCYPMILGNVTDFPLSENLVIAKILIETKAASQKLMCQQYEEKNFKPELLDHKRGCSLVVDSSRCTLLQCPKKIFLDGVEQTHIQYVSGVNFEWVPTSYRSKIYSFKNLFEESNYKIQEIQNITQYIQFMEKSPKNIAVSIACGEVLFPEVYFQNSMNHCTPMAIILDGYNFENLIHYASIKSPLDSNLQSKWMRWDRLMAATQRYVSIHPEKFWSLYGISLQQDIQKEEKK